MNSVKPLFLRHHAGLAWISNYNSVNFREELRLPDIQAVIFIIECVTNANRWSL